MTTSLRWLLGLATLAGAGAAIFVWRQSTVPQVAASAVAVPVVTPTVVPAPAPVVAPAPVPAPVPAIDAAKQRKARLYAEVVLRLKGADLTTDAETKAMVDKALAANQGTPSFVEIVEAFAIVDRDADLLRFAIEHPGESVGALALRLVLGNSGTTLVKPALEGPDAAAVAKALGNANDQRALPLLAPIVRDAARELSLRQASVRAMGQFEAGAMELLALSKSSELPADLQAIATGVLANAPWEAVRAEVRRAMPAPATMDGGLPPIHELAARTGDPVRGEQVFGALCIVCHQVAGKGIDFGPNLSAIGSKLGKDGLYQAILYPDAGIEFNFETTQLGLRDGNSAIGIVQSDTEQEVAIKTIGGTVSRYRAADIVRRDKQRTSSMPTGLQSSLRQQDLVDLVEYLAALQKK